MPISARDDSTQDRFGGREGAARDTARPWTEDLEDGVPLPLLKHGIEVLRARSRRRRRRRLKFTGRAELTAPAVGSGCWSK